MSAADAPRLAAHMQIGAMIRRAQNEGGFITVLRKGDLISGSILVQTIHQGQETGLFERTQTGLGRYEILPCATKYWDNPQELAQYIERRVKSDPDMWLIELDIADAERFIAISLQ